MEDIPLKDFILDRIPTRTTLLDYAEGVDPDVKTKLSQDPNGWVEELGVLYAMLSGDQWGCMIGELPPQEDVETLSDDVIIASPQVHKRNSGLWIRDIERDEWKHFRMGEKAVLRARPDVQDTGLLLPENFTEKGELVKDQKRPIIRFIIDLAEAPVEVYAKGSVSNTSYYHNYSKPSHRKTSVAGISHLRPMDEFRSMQTLSGLGVAVPHAIGMYEGLTEQWLFLEGIKGKEPLECLDDPAAKLRIIGQDARMLAALCRAGYRKQGFHDSDDKVYDGSRLFLIDTDEVVDLYGYMGIDFRRMLLDPRDDNKLKEFQAMQRGIFISTLRDAVFEYRKTLLEREEDAVKYVSKFSKALNFNLTPEEIATILDTGEDHMTTDRYIAIMLDN
jgi:hypothetical protein